MHENTRIVLLKQPDGTVAHAIRVDNYDDNFPAVMSSALESCQRSDRPTNVVLMTVLHDAGYKAEPVSTAEFTMPDSSSAISNQVAPWDAGIIRTIGWTSSDKHPDPGMDTVHMTVTLNRSVNPESPAFRNKTLVYKQLLYGRVRNCPGPDSIVSMSVTSDTDRDGDPRLTYDIAYKKGESHGRSVGAEPTPFWPG